MWQDYYATVDGIVFIVDAADRTRFAEVSEELQRLFEAEGLARVPIVILGNKIDIPVAASEDEVRQRIGLPHHLTVGQDAKKGACSVRPVELFMVSIKRRMGYDAAFRWLSEFL
uniref:Uncharacterized protein n=1 Tax=Alexandrium andersonii TaxID=327968 RepID=A0A7S2AF67_9DINO